MYFVKHFQDSLITCQYCLFDIYLVDDYKIHRIATILSDDATASRMKDQIYRELGLPAAELVALNTKFLIDGCHSYPFFLSMLENYKSRNGANGMLEKLINHLIKLNLRNVAGKIQ